MSKTMLNPSALASVMSGESKSFGAAFTVRSKATGADYTFKVSRAEFNSVWYTHVRVETEYLQFKYLGFFTGRYIIRKGAEVTTPSAKAASWLLRKVVSNEDLSQVEIFHLGKCLKCGRTLTDATSIEYGIGPTCRNK